MQYLIYADGSYHDKIADGSFAVYLISDDECIDLLHSTLKNEQPLHISRRIRFAHDSKKTTNNFAEASILQAVIIWCCSNNVFEQDIVVHICMDSQLVLGQFVGLSKTNSKKLKNIYCSIYNLLATKSSQLNKKLDQLLKFHWVSGKVMKASIIGH